MSRWTACALGALLVVVGCLSIGSAVASASTAAPAAAPSAKPAPDADVPVCPANVGSPRLAKGANPTTVEARVKGKCTSGEKVGLKACIQTEANGTWKTVGSCVTTPQGGPGKQVTARVSVPRQCGTKTYRTHVLFTVNGKPYPHESKEVKVKGKAC